MKNIIKQQYRPGAKVGNGSTSDVIRYEKATGILLSDKGHITKGKLDSEGLKNLIEGGLLEGGDKTIASKILKDLTNAINGK